MFTRQLPSILPPMTRDECLEVTQIFSVAELLSKTTRWSPMSFVSFNFSFCPIFNKFNTSSIKIDKNNIIPAVSHLMNHPMHPHVFTCPEGISLSTDHQFGCSYKPATQNPMRRIEKGAWFPCLAG
jgi:hypothetical protein